MTYYYYCQWWKWKSSASGMRHGTWSMREFAIVCKWKGRLLNTSRLLMSITGTEGWLCINLTDCLLNSFIKFNTSNTNLKSESFNLPLPFRTKWWTSGCSMQFAVCSRNRQIQNERVYGIIIKHKCEAIWFMFSAKVYVCLCSTGNNFNLFNHKIAVKIDWIYWNHENQWMKTQMALFYEHQKHRNNLKYFRFMIEHTHTQGFTAANT